MLPVPIAAPRFRSCRDASTFARSIPQPRYAPGMSGDQRSAGEEDDAIEEEDPAPVKHRPASTRLFVILARRAPRAVIFRRGPSKHVALILWHTDTDKFEVGQWF